jgi:hypothetical protein
VTAASYRVEIGDPRRDRERILDSWQRCGFATGIDAAARYDWFYLGNPRGPGRVYLLFNGDELVGSMGAGTRLFVAGKDEPPLRGAVLVDFVVHPAHRSMFPALQLQRLAREHELRDNNLVYGLPEAKAAPIFKRLGASRQFASGSHVHVLRSANYALPRTPRVAVPLVRLLCWFADRGRLASTWLLCRLFGLRGQWVSGLPAGIDAFWDRDKHLGGCATGERNEEYLAWRFRAAQREGVSFLELTRAGRDGLVAIFVCRRERSDLQVLDMMIADRGGIQVPKFLALSLAAWTLGVDSVRVIFGGCVRTQRSLVRAGFFLRDQRTCFVMQGAPAGEGGLPLEWWLTKADEDV